MLTRDAQSLPNQRAGSTALYHRYCGAMGPSARTRNILFADTASDAIEESFSSGPRSGDVTRRGFVMIYAAQTIYPLL
jgi:hypothetical protein